MGLLGGALLAAVRVFRNMIHWAALDEDSCFTAIVPPTHFGHWQAGPRVKASAVPRDRWLPHWTADTIVRPLYERLAMGSSWSVFLVMVIHRWLLLTP